MQYDINREAAKVSALSSGQIYKNQYLAGEKILFPNQRKIIEPAKFVCIPWGKSFKKQTEKQVGAKKSLKPSNKKDELKQIESIFWQNLINDLILEKLKKINLQDIIKKDDQNYESKWGKTSNFSEYSLPIFRKYI